MATDTAVDVVMPQMGVSVSEGTITKWLKQEGEQVEADEPLLEVSTDKVDTEIPSPAAGVLSKILVAEDETVEVGAELAVIGGDGGGAGAVKLVQAVDGPVVGVHMVGSRVGELIAEAQLIYNWEAEADDVAALIHPHPTQSEALGEAHLALAGKPLHVHG